MTPRRSLPRIAAAAVLAAAALAGAVGAPAPVAAGGSYPLWGGDPTFGEAVTWVDGAGRLRGAWIEDRFEEPRAYDLLIARHTAAEQPDPAWGTDPEQGTPGVRRIALDPPEGAMYVSLAAAADGSLSIAYRGSVLCGDDLCPRAWFDRRTGDGAGIGTRTVVATGLFPSFGLQDGSHLFGLDATVRWFAPDGAQRAALTLPSPPVSAAVDGSGRLVVITADAQLRRVSAAGEVELSHAVDCPGGADGPKAVGAAADGGYAVACGTGDAADARLIVRRYGPTGTALWTTTVRGTSWRPAVPQAATIDTSGRVWVGAETCSPFDGTWLCFGGQLSVFPVDAGGVGAEMISTQERVSQVRSIGSSRVAVAISGPSCSFCGDVATFDTLPLPALPPTCTPTSPAVSAAGPASATVRFVRCPGTAGSSARSTAPTGYRIEALSGAGSVVASASVGASATSGTVSGLSAGERYRFRVRATNAGGAGPASSLTPWTTPPFRTFSQFVERQHLDLTGRLPTSTQRTQAVAALGNGTTTPVAYIDARLSDPWSGPRIEAIARLYRAYFLRDPDSGGLAFWVGRNRSGTNLQRISSQFAESSEFRNRYGRLTNRQFVERVYANVLGRPGDPAGVAYWTRQLDERRRNRGEVMVGFSESNEYKRRSGPRIQVVAVVFGMLGRTATASELSTWSPQLEGGASRRTVIAAVLATPAYAARA